MSRSNPHTELTNPSQRWFDFNGGNGTLSYYDKTEKKNIDVKIPFTFIVLDSLSTIKGWHDTSDSGITSNEVRDTTKDVMFVKSFKGGKIAEGFYRDIKDTIVAKGGKFVSSIYIAFKDGEEFKIGNIQFSGASLNAWVEFSKQNRADIMKKAVVINGTAEGKKGSIKYQFPTFVLKEISESTNQVATDLDKELQAYLSLYIASKKVEEQANINQEPSKPDNMNQEVDYTAKQTEWKPIEEDELPF